MASALAHDASRREMNHASAQEAFSKAPVSIIERAGSSKRPGSNVDDMGRLVESIGGGLRTGELPAYCHGSSGAAWSYEFKLLGDPVLLWGVKKPVIRRSSGCRDNGQDGIPKVAARHGTLHSYILMAVLDNTHGVDEEEMNIIEMSNPGSVSNGCWQAGNRLTLFPLIYIGREKLRNPWISVEPSMAQRRVLYWIRNVWQPGRVGQTLPQYDFIVVIVEIEQSVGGVIALIRGVLIT